jgi:hypothetical protein
MMEKINIKSKNILGSTHNHNYGSNNEKKSGGGKKKRKTKRESIKHTESESDFIKNQYPKICGPYTYIPAILPAQHRVIVFGDVHGHYGLTIDMFVKAKLIRYDQTTDDSVWIGKDAYVVQVGDQIDRCRPLPGLSCNDPRTTFNDEANDIKILEFFNKVGLQAEKAGGMIISLLGNHELLNVMGDMSYVSYEGIKQFEAYKDSSSPDVKFSNGTDARIHAFKPGNQYAKMMGCTRLPAVIIGSNLFVHAGVVDALIKEINLKGLDDFERINIKIRKWLMGLLNQDYVENIIRYSKNSMFWTRILGKIPPGVSLNNPDCFNNIKGVLDLFEVGSIVVGHTPQSFLFSDDINSTCSGKVWRVDNGSSAAFNKYDPTFRKTGVNSHSRRTQYLEILDDDNYFVCDGDGCKKN